MEDNRTISEKLVAWYENDNGHSLDNERLYDVVIETAENKISQQSFEASVKECENFNPNTVADSYSKYERLWNFLEYYQKECK